MKTRILAVAAAAFLLSTIMVGRCQAQQLVRANIPFEFTVGNNTLPPGEYEILQPAETIRDLRLIRRTDGSAGMMVLTIAADRQSSNAQAELIFHRYGHEFFLSQIWTPAGTGQNLYQSRREKELASGETPKEVALLLAGPTAGR
jgi:hypothetical protein